MVELVKNFENSNNNSSLKVKLQAIDDVDFCVIIYLDGYIDNQSVSVLQDELDKLIAAGYINYIFDCEDLESVASSSISVFTDLEAKVKPYGGDLVFYELNGNAYDVFNLLGFCDYFSIASDIEDAIEILLYKEDEVVVEKKEIFPISFECPICAVRLKAEKSGTFQCGKCKTILNITEEGNVSLG